MSLSGWRPTSVRSLSSRNLLPALGPRRTASSAVPGGSVSHGGVVGASTHRRARRRGRCRQSRWSRWYRQPGRLAAGSAACRSASRTGHPPDSLHRMPCSRRWASDRRASHSSAGRRRREQQRAAAAGCARSPAGTAQRYLRRPLGGPCATRAGNPERRRPDRPRPVPGRRPAVTGSRSPAGHRRDAFATCWPHLRRAYCHRKRPAIVSWFAAVPAARSLVSARPAPPPRPTHRAAPARCRRPCPRPTGA